jgi:hypothetical protein
MTDCISEMSNDSFPWVVFLFVAIPSHFNYGCIGEYGMLMYIYASIVCLVLVN